MQLREYNLISMNRGLDPEEAAKLDKPGRGGFCGVVDMFGDHIGSIGAALLMVMATRAAFSKMGSKK